MLGHGDNEPAANINAYLDPSIATIPYAFGSPNEQRLFGIRARLTEETRTEAQNVLYIGASVPSQRYRLTQR